MSPPDRPHCCVCVITVIHIKLRCVFLSHSGGTEERIVSWMTSRLECTSFLNRSIVGKAAFGPRWENFYLHIHLPYRSQCMRMCRIPFIMSRLRPESPGSEKVEHAGWDLLMWSERSRSGFLCLFYFCSDSNITEGKAYVQNRKGAVHSNHTFQTWI